MQRRPIESAATIQLPLKPSVLTVPLLSSCDPCEDRIPKSYVTKRSRRASRCDHPRRTRWHRPNLLGHVHQRGLNVVVPEHRVARRADEPLSDVRLHSTRQHCRKHALQEYVHGGVSWAVRATAGRRWRECPVRLAKHTSAGLCGRARIVDRHSCAPTHGAFPCHAVLCHAVHCSGRAQSRCGCGSGRAQSRCGCGSGRAQSRCRCGSGRAQFRCGCGSGRAQFRCGCGREVCERARSHTAVAHRPHWR